MLVHAVAALRLPPTSPSATGATTSHAAELYRRRRDAMLDALAEHFPRRGDVDPARTAGCSSGPRCPTTSTRPTCWRGRCARTSRSCPGRAAYLDGRGGVDAAQLLRRRRGRHRRGRAPHRRGRRASRSRSTATLTGGRAGEAAAARGGAARRRRAPTCCARAGARMSRVARAQGRALARAPGVAALRRAGRGRARAPRPRRGRDRRRRRPGRAAARGAARRRVRRAARPRTARTAPCRSCSRSSACRTPAPARSACIRCMDKVLAKHAMRDAGSRRPTSSRSARPRSRSSAPPRRCRRSRSGSASRSSSSPPRQGSALGIKFARDRRRRPERARRRVLLRHAVLLERYVEGRELAVSVLDGRRAGGAAGGRGDPEASEDFYDFEARYEIGRTDFVCPRGLAPRSTARGAGAGAGRLSAARLLRLRARRPDARRRRRAQCSRPTRSPA